MGGGKVEGHDPTPVVVCDVRDGRQGTGHRRGVDQDVEAADTQVDRIAQLVEAGVVLTSEGRRGPFYLFTGLNEVKPGMIAEATANARAGAEQFAKDSGSAIEGIQRASQGLFQICLLYTSPSPRDRTRSRMPSSA